MNDMSYTNQLVERMKSHAIVVIKISRSFPSNVEFKIIASQMIKSVTSIGANYREAQSATSKSDFIAKVRISLKEASESTYWLQLVHELLAEPNQELNQAVDESIELERILGSIIKTSKTNIKKKSI